MAIRKARLQINNGEKFYKYDCCHQWGDHLRRERKIFQPCKICGKKPKKLVAIKKPCAKCNKIFVLYKDKDVLNIQNCESCRNDYADVPKKPLARKTCSCCNHKPVGPGLRFLCQDCYENPDSKEESFSTNITGHLLSNTIGGLS